MPSYGRSRLVFSWVALLATSVLQADGLPDTAIATFDLEESRGDIVRDVQNGLTGSVVGGATWVQRGSSSALAFDGRTFVRVGDAAKLSPGTAVSIAAWIRGTGSPMRYVDGYPGFRSPHFQVVGDVIHLMTNSDDAPYRGSDHAKVVSSGSWPLWSGSARIDLSAWTYTRRISSPTSSLEPKLQVVGNTIYSEYFGEDAQKVWQIFTARAKSDGSGWNSVQRTNETDQADPYRVEQSSNVYVQGDRVYFGFPRRNSHGTWQLVTASHRLDGTDYQERQQTFSSEGAWIPATQVVGRKVFYLYATAPSTGALKNRQQEYRLYFASADLDGANWKVLRQVASAPWVLGWGAFQIHNGIAYLVYKQEINEQTGWSALFTATMSLDGSALTPVRRTFEPGFSGPGHSSIQVIGDRVYYVYTQIVTQHTVEEWRASKRSSSLGEEYVHSYWTADAMLDGNDWHAQRRCAGVARDVPVLGYKGVQVVGGKQYYSVNKVLNGAWQLQGVLATSGSNVVSKGDAFGIGVTERGDVRAFINAGQDYLFRGEAPSDTAGATVDAPLGEGWHHVAMTFDSAQLRLYVGGKLRGTKSYSTVPARNPFPLLIGDGFQGMVDKVAVYDKALSPAEIDALARAP